MIGTYYLLKFIPKLLPVFFSWNIFLVEVNHEHFKAITHSLFSLRFWYVKDIHMIWSRGIKRIFHLLKFSLLFKKFISPCLLLLEAMLVFERGHFLFPLLSSGSRVPWDREFSYDGAANQHRSWHMIFDYYLSSIITNVI